jgi:membrane protein required for colicin V production
VNWLDIAIVVVILGFAYAGLSLGLVREGVALLAAVLGVLLAGRFYERLASDIGIISNDTLTDDLIAFLVIFAAMLLAGEIVAGLLRAWTQAMLLDDTVDSIGGLACGFLQGFVCVGLVLIAFTAFPAASWMTRAVDGSLLAPVFLKGVPVLLHLLPAAIRQAVQGG